MTMFYVGGMVLLILGNSAQAMRKTESGFREWFQMLLYSGIVIAYLLITASSSESAMKTFVIATFLLFLFLYTLEVVNFIQKINKEGKILIWDIVMFFMSAIPIIFQFIILV